MDRWAISRIHQECGCPDPTADRTIRNMLGDYTRDKVLNGETIKQATRCANTIWTNSTGCGETARFWPTGGIWPC